MEVDQGEKVEVRVAGRWACDHFIDYFHPNDDDDQGRGVFFIMGRRDNKYAPCLEVVLPRALNVNTAMTFSLSTVRDLYLGAASQPSRARQEERTAWYNKRLMREGIRT